MATVVQAAVLSLFGMCFAALIWLDVKLTRAEKRVKLLTDLLEKNREASPRKED